MNRENPELLLLAGELPTAFKATGLGLETAGEILTGATENLKFVDSLLKELSTSTSTDTFLEVFSEYNLDRLVLI